MPAATPLPDAPGALSLRVSVATLARVRFAHPEGGAPLLALERKASAARASVPGAGVPTAHGPSAHAPTDHASTDPGLSAYASTVHVHAQPFGGGMRLLDQAALQAAIGAFEFDSQRSADEDDFRLLIRPEAWAAVQQFCREHFVDDDPVLEADPARELTEEFADALGVDLAPEQYRQRPLGAWVGTRLTPTLSPRAAGRVTARIYRLFDVEILDGALARTMLANSLGHTDDDLAQQALAQAGAGGRGRANAVLAVPLAALTQAYLALPPEARAAPLTFEQHALDANVPVVLDGLALPDFRSL